MKSTLIRTATVAVAALGALALGAGTASAATTFTVKAGTAANGTVVPITGTTTGASPQVTFKDTSSATTLNCASSKAPGSTKVGTGLPGTKIGTINGAATTFTGCTGPLGLVLKVTGSGTWNINATSGNTTAVNGTISAIKAKVADTNGQCSFTVTGSVAGRIVDSNSTLALPGTTSKLTISAVTGCFGLITNGDVASFKATYKLTATTAAFNPIKVTAP